MIHAMIDLETLSTNPDAVILTVGGIKFNPFSKDKPHTPLYFKVDVDSQTSMGRHVMEDTLQWWQTQPQEIQDEALGEDDRITLADMVKQINKWAVGVEVFWCQGPLFDYAILQNIYKQLGNPVPWQYWQIRDSRTVFSLLPRDFGPTRTGAHNALADCDYQAKKLQDVFEHLKIKRF